MNTSRVDGPRRSPAASAPSTDDGTYTVQRGDTLTAIAREHGVSLPALLAANPQIRNPNLIHPGQAVNLPGRTAAPPPAPGAAAPAPHRPAAPRLPPAPGVNPGVLSTPSEQPTPTAIPPGARVAVMGDSHTHGAFGAELRTDLQRHLEEGGGTITSFTGVPSASVQNFLSGTDTRAGSQTFHTPSVDKVLQDRPDVLVVALGSNQLGNSVEGNKAQIRGLLDKADAAGAKVMWVGPPNMRGYGNNLQGGAPEARFYQALNEVNAERKAAGRPGMGILDSRPSTSEGGTSDGVHFSGAAARTWADSISSQLTRPSRPGGTGGTTPAPPVAAASSVSPAELRRIVPNLSAQKAADVAPHLSNAMREAGITTVRQKAAFIAQLAHESGGFRYMEEIASGAAYEGRRDLGNTQPGDGVRFKGRGYIQVTGRANYTAAGRALGLDLVNHPELAARPENAARIAAWFWKSRDLNRVAESGNFDEVTRRINGGYNGKAARDHYNAVALRVLSQEGGGADAPSATGGAGSVPDGGGHRYVVRSGDALSRIAAQHGTSLAALLRLNPSITNPNRIYVGQVITLS